MQIVRVDPFGEATLLRADMNHVVARAVGGSGRRTAWLPPVDVVDSGDAVVITADLPGLDPDEVTVEMHDDVLTLSGERRGPAHSEGPRNLRAERAYGRFQRVVRLPAGTDATEVRAIFDRGVLEVRVPRPAAAGPHRIPVTTTVREAS